MHRATAARRSATLRTWAAGLGAGAFALAVLTGPALGGDSAPRIPKSAKIAPIQAPYDETADAAAEIDAAFARAKASGKRVLIDFGGNWCPDCRVLAGMFAIPAFEKVLDAHYEVVLVDIGSSHYDRNQDLVRRFGIERLEGVPTVVIATPDGEIVNAGTSAEWTTARDRQAQEALDYFWRYAGDGAGS